jgi:hypothetical protein
MAARKLLTLHPFTHEPAGGGPDGSAACNGVGACLRANAILLPVQ